MSFLSSHDSFFFLYSRTKGRIVSPLFKIIFLSSNRLSSWLHHSGDYQIWAVLSPLIWFISGKNLLYPGRICTYEADKSLRTVTLSRLMLFNGLLSCCSSSLSPSSLFMSPLLSSNYRNFKKDKFTCYPSCLFSLIFNWCFYLYDRLLFIEIIYS